TNLTETVTVPIQAVATVKGNQVCLVKHGSATKTVPVEVGLYSDRFIEIKSGLKEGDQVLLSTMAASDNIDLSGSIAGNEETNNKAAGHKTHSGKAGEHVKSLSNTLDKAARARTNLMAVTTPSALLTNLPPLFK